MSGWRTARPGRQSRWGCSHRDRSDYALRPLVLSCLSKASVDAGAAQTNEARAQPLARRNRRRRVLLREEWAAAA
jgi:hypothetical protein